MSMQMNLFVTDAAPSTSAVSPDLLSGPKISLKASAKAKIAKQPKNKRHPLAHHLDAITWTDNGDNTSTAVVPTVSIPTYREICKILEISHGRYKRKCGHVFPVPAEIAKAEILKISNTVPSGRANDTEFFPTPDELADKLLSLMILNDEMICHLAEQPNTRLLEPSAGSGSLIKAFLRRFPDFQGEIVTCEVNPLRAWILKNSGIPNLTVIEADFLTAEISGTFNICLTNPPFSKWHEHFTKARSLLNPQHNGANAFIGSIVPDLEHCSATARNSDKTDIMCEALATGILDPDDDNLFEKNKEATPGQRTSIKTSCLILTGMPSVASCHAFWTELALEGIISNYDVQKRLKNIRSTTEIKKWLMRNRYDLAGKHQIYLHSQFSDFDSLAKEIFLRRQN